MGSFLPIECYVAQTFACAQGATDFDTKYEAPWGHGIMWDSLNKCKQGIIFVLYMYICAVFISLSYVVSGWIDRYEPH